MTPHVFRRSVCFLPLVLFACAVPAPYVHPTVVALPATEASKLVAATEARLFPCSFVAVRGDNAVDVKGRHPEVSLPPGHYQVTLECTSGYHAFKPQVGFVARPGKVYRVTGYLVDDSITIFTMRMRAKVEELAPQ